jgi:putative transposase
MRYSDSILGDLLKPISRRWFDALVDRHDGDAYDKSFGSWDHFVALLYAQLGGVQSLRGLEAAWNANAHHHYHLGAGRLARSTLADASARRPLRDPHEENRPLQGASLAAAQEAQGGRLHHLRRC